jgi:phenylacetate-CoA ligase
VPQNPGLLRDFYEMLFSSQFWPEERLVAFQRSQLGQLLRHARTSVPFYESRLDAVFRSNGEIDWDRWTEIPIVTRRDMINHRDAMQSRSMPTGHGPTEVLSTSGSTSLPIQITTTALLNLAADACRWRGHVWNEIDWSQNLAVRLGNSTAPIDRPAGELKGQWGPPWLDKRGSVFDLNVRLPATHVLEFLREQDCTYLNTGAAPAHVFALEAERLGLTPPPLKAILAQGASIGDGDRAACMRVFGAPIIGSYSSKEGGQMAHPCECGTLHISAETCIVEIVDADGKPVPRGTSGRVIITPFFNTAQPLIRYDQGDIARLDEPCRCGRTLPTMGAIEGRHSIFFTHPDGRKATSLLPERGRAALKCTFWQIAQVGPLQFEVRYVPDDWTIHGDEEEFIRIFRAQYFDDAEVRLKRLREIPLSASGKYIEYKVEMEREPA